MISGRKYFKAMFSEGKRNLNRNICKAEMVIINEVKSLIFLWFFAKEGGGRSKEAEGS